MSLTADLRVLYHCVFTRGGGNDHRERLEAFYRHQADAYDDFRRRLLHGRREMLDALDLPDGGRLIDMGGGTGSNIESLGPRLERLRNVTIVDLCPSLLRAADERILRQGWTNVVTTLADATTYEPETPVDAVTFSYSFTMIPDWFKAIDRAYAMLKPGGTIGVVDFYISRKWPAAGMHRHSRWRRFFWPMWFSWDNVFLSSEHLPYLQSRFQTVRLEERLGRMPYMFWMRSPHYIFIGRK